MPFMIALAIIWAVPFAAFTVLALGGAGSDQLLIAGYLGLYFGVPVALVVSAIVLPAVALSQLATACERRRTH